MGQTPWHIGTPCPPAPNQVIRQCWAGLSFATQLDLRCAHLAGASQPESQASEFRDLPQNKLQLGIAPAPHLPPPGRVPHASPHKLTFTSFGALRTPNSIFTRIPTTSVLLFPKMQQVESRAQPRSSRDVLSEALPRQGLRLKAPNVAGHLGRTARPGI